MPGVYLFAAIDDPRPSDKAQLVFYKYLETIRGRLMSHDGIFRRFDLYFFLKFSLSQESYHLS